MRTDAWPYLLSLFNFDLEKLLLTGPGQKGFGCVRVWIKGSSLSSSYTKKGRLLDLLNKKVKL